MQIDHVDGNDFQWAVCFSLVSYWWEMCLISLPNRNILSFLLITALIPWLLMNWMRGISFKVIFSILPLLGEILNTVSLCITNLNNCLDFYLFICLLIYLASPFPGHFHSEISLVPALTSFRFGAEELLGALGRFGHHGNSSRNAPAFPILKKWTDFKIC